MHDSLIRELIGRYHGYEINTGGWGAAPGCWRVGEAPPLAVAGWVGRRLRLRAGSSFSCRLAPP